MKELSKSALTILGTLFAIMLLAFTGYQTFRLLLEVSGSPVIAVVGLVMFEGGMLYWWQVFRAQAEGLLQMSLSLLVFLACLVFVILATSLELGAVDRTVLGANTPAKIITAAAIIQLAAKLFFPLFHPEVTQAITERVQEGKILSAADDKFNKRIDGIANGYADAMVEERTDRLMTRFNTKYHTRYELGPGRSPIVIEGQSEGQSENVTPRRTWRDRMFGSRPQPEMATVVNSTQDVSAPELRPRDDAGQGTRSASPAIRLPDDFETWTDAQKSAWIISLRSGPAAAAATAPAENGHPNA